MFQLQDSQGCIIEEDKSSCLYKYNVVWCINYRLQNTPLMARTNCILVRTVWPRLGAGEGWSSAVVVSLSSANWPSLDKLAENLRRWANKQLL